MRGLADLSPNIPSEIFGRSLGYRRIAISKFSKKRARNGDCAFGGQDALVKECVQNYI